MLKTPLPPEEVGLLPVKFPAIHYFGYDLQEA